MSPPLIIDDSVVDDDVKGITFAEICNKICYDFVSEDVKKGIIITEKNIIAENCLPSLFDATIPLRTGYKLLTINEPTIVTTSMEENVVSETLQHSSLFILFTMCCQRGPATGCPYQVPINCRALSISNLICSEDGVNLMESATTQSMQNSFGEGDLSGLTFFGVQESNNNAMSEDACEFEMPSRMSLVTDNNFKVGEAVLRGRKAVKISAFHFKKACRFFNRVWGELDEDGNIVEFPDDRPLTSNDISSFAMIFEGHQLGSAEGWCRFLEHFKLARMFPFEEGTHVLVHIRRFGEYFRALVPLDCGVSRGQHRCHTMGFLGSGFINCCARAPLHRFTGGTLYLMLF